MGIIKKNNILLIVLFVICCTFFVSGDMQEVVVMLNDSSKINSVGVSEVDNFESMYTFESVSAITVNVSDADLLFLQNKEGVEKVVLNHKVGLFLQDSIELIGADVFWSMNNSSYTGINQSVCVIDTGVDFSHDVFGGEWGDVVIGGKRFLGGDIVDCSINNSACLDDHGHGTHVAGIVKAVSPGAKIVAVKVLDSNGDGFSSDVQKAIDYCISVADDFNITVISMSLGAPCFDEFGNSTNLCHEDYCDALYPSYYALINQANAKNISVVAATGNSALSNVVSSPSCLESVFRVGSSNKNNELSWFTNVWSHDMFLAPGHFINSTDLNNGYRVRSGTSMATPHFSAGLVLLKNYYGVSSNDSFLRDEIIAEGVLIYDEYLDMNFTRLNLLFNVEEPVIEDPVVEDPVVEDPVEPENPEVLPDEEIIEEPDPVVDDPIIEEPDVQPVKRGGGCGDHTVTIFEEEELVQDPVLINFLEVGDYVRSLKSGDLLFMGDNSVYSTYLVPKKWKHTLIYLGPEFEVRQNFGVNSDVYLAVKDYYVNRNEILVLDSSYVGVSIRDIRDFGYHEFAAFRPVQSRERNEEMLSYAVSQIGKPYDKLFSTKDNAFYCSELLFKSLNNVGFDLESSNFVWFNKVILPSDLAAQFSERDDFSFLFYVAKYDGIFLEKQEEDLFDGPKKPVINEFKILFLEKGLLSYAVWILSLFLVYSIFFNSKKKFRRGKK